MSDIRERIRESSIIRGAKALLSVSKEPHGHIAEVGGTIYRFISIRENRWGDLYSVGRFPTRREARASLRWWDKSDRALDGGKPSPALPQWPKNRLGAPGLVR